jgi:predicted DNA-binding transcriptional regulator AlpA
MSTRQHSGKSAQDASRVDRLVNRGQLRKLVPVSDMTIWRWERAELFPHHVSINVRNYWRLGEILAWLENLSVN